MKPLLIFILVTSTYLLKAQSAPQAANDTFTIPKNVPVALPVLSNDTDADGDTLSVTLIINPVFGNAVVSGAVVTYTSALNFMGIDSLFYRVCDNTSLCDSAWVLLYVTGTNQAPDASDDSFVFADTLSSASLNVLLNDSDADGDSLFVSSIAPFDSTTGIGFCFTLPGGDVAFQRNGVACGTQQFIYIVCDGSLCDTALVNISITCPENISETQGFSPNGDGINDVLVFTGLEYFSPASLRVFNRYGTLVYESDDYQNNWDGKWQDKNQPLPDGTYYYRLQLADKRIYKNYIMIVR